MSPARDRHTITLTLSEMAIQEFQEIADAKGIPLATYVRGIIETHHESPAFSSLLKRCRAKQRGEETW